MLTLRVKPNDEVSLKYSLQDYAKRTKGLINNFRPKRKDCCKDPNFVLIQDDLIHFRARTVVITMTNIQYRLDENGNLLGAYYYIWVKDRTGREAHFPIEFIDRNRNLKRDHKKISLHNKTLICG
jgi:hypothetical protein